MKYRNHPSFIAIRSKCKDKGSFNFIEINQKQIEKKILKLAVNKASQSSDIPIKVLKENSDIFSNFLCNSFNNSIKFSTFPEILKHANITPLYKKGKKDIKQNYRPVSIFQILNIYQKYFKNACLNKCHNFLRTYQCGFPYKIYFIFLKISIWVSEGFSYPAMSSGNVRKMEKVC